MNTYVHLWKCLAQFFTEWEMFQTKCVEKIKTHISCSITFSRRSCRLWDMWENRVEPDMPQMTTRRMRFACWMNRAIDTNPYLLLLHGNNGNVKAPRCYVILVRAVPVLLDKGTVHQFMWLHCTTHHECRVAKNHIIVNIRIPPRTAFLFG
jgi:hypothetical protein